MYIIKTISKYVSEFNHIWQTELKNKGKKLPFVLCLSLGSLFTYSAWVFSYLGFKKKDIYI